jgi:hypothetical protein
MNFKFTEVSLLKECAVWSITTQCHCDHDKCTRCLGKPCIIIYQYSRTNITQVIRYVRQSHNCTKYVILYVIMPCYNSCNHIVLFRLLLRQLPWHFAVGEGGKVVAILQDTILEIRTSRDEYSSIVGMASSKWAGMLHNCIHICIYIVIHSILYSIYNIT